MNFADWRDSASYVESAGLKVAFHDSGAELPGSASVGSDQGGVAREPRPRQHGPTVTYLHGYPSSSIDFVGVIDRVGGSDRHVSLDFPGFGASEKPPGHPYTIHAATDAVEAVWAATGVTETILVSHDYAVSVGQELLARRIDGTLQVAITKAIWCNGGLYPDLHRQTLGQQILRDPEKGPELAQGMTEEGFVGGIAGTWGQRIEMPEHEIHAMWESMAHEGGSRIMNELLHYIDDRLEHADRWRNALETTTDIPMIFVWGDLDPVSGAHMIARVEENMPHADVRRMADVAHWPPLEAPDDLAAAIRAAG